MRKAFATIPYQRGDEEYRSGRKHRGSEDEGKRVRAAPSPTPPGLGRSHESLLSSHNKTDEQIYPYLSGKMQYLDLDLDCAPSSLTGGSTNMQTSKLSDSNIVYKEVDFKKTEAFNITRHNLEKERQEPVSFLKK